MQAIENIDLILVVAGLAGLLLVGLLYSLRQYQNANRELQSRLETTHKIPVLGEHLARLKQGESVTDPVRLTAIEARKYILFETHFGRAHKDTGKHIDLLVWLDTPPDVALARNVRGLLAPMLPGGGIAPSAERLAALSGYLGKYVDNIRSLQAVQVEQVSTDADVHLDGSLDVHENAVRLRDMIMERLP